MSTNEQKATGIVTDQTSLSATTIGLLTVKPTIISIDISKTSSGILHWRNSATATIKIGAAVTIVRLGCYDLWAGISEEGTSRAVERHPSHIIVEADPSTLTDRYLLYIEQNLTVSDLEAQTMAWLSRTVDWSDVLNEYKMLCIKTCAEQQVQEHKLRESAWDSSWAHEFIKAFKAHSDHLIQAGATKICPTISLSTTRERFLDAARSGELCVIIKDDQGHSVSVDNSHSSRSTYYSFYGGDRSDSLKRFTRIDSLVKAVHRKLQAMRAADAAKDDAMARASGIKPIIKSLLPPNWAAVLKDTTPFSARFSLRAPGSSQWDSTITLIYNHEVRHDGRHITAGIHYLMTVAQAQKFISFVDSLVPVADREKPAEVGEKEDVL